MCCLSFYTTIVHLLCQTCQNEKENYIFLSRYQQTTYSVPLFLPCFWGVAFCPNAIFNRGVLPQGVWGVLPRCHKSISHNELRTEVVWHYAPWGVWHSAPPWHFAPVLFAHLFFLARFSAFWHDFHPVFLFLARYKPIPPKELQSTMILSL